MANQPVKNSLTSLEAHETGLIYVNIRAPEKNVFEGVVESLTATNTDGSFDILPYHENFISLIKGNMIVREQNKPVKTIDVGNAIMKVSKNKVNVYIGMEEILPTKTQEIKKDEPRELNKK
jgi:F-type H+-transporting ATPase subunit epsilon